MTQTKSIIIGHILKLDKPFKPREIWEPLGISRQVLNTYLTRFKDAGALFSDPHGFYQVTDKAYLIDLMAGSERRRLELPKDSAIFHNGDLRAWLPWAVAQRTLQTEDCQIIIRAANEALDAQIEQLKVAKKYLNNKQMVPSKAEQAMKEFEFADKFRKALQIQYYGVEL